MKMKVTKFYEWASEFHAGTRLTVQDAVKSGFDKKTAYNGFRALLKEQRITKLIKKKNSVRFQYRITSKMFVQRPSTRGIAIFLDKL